MGIALGLPVAAGGPLIAPDALRNCLGSGHAMGSCIGKFYGEWRGQGVSYSRRSLGCGLRWPLASGGRCPWDGQSFWYAWRVFVCRVARGLPSCSPSTRTYILPSVSPYTLYRMICSSLLSASVDDYVNRFFQGRLSYRITYYCTRACEECLVNAPGVASCRGRFHGNHPGIARCSGRPLGDCTRCIVKLRGGWPCNGQLHWEAPR